MLDPGRARSRLAAFGTAPQRLSYARYEWFDAERLFNIGKCRKQARIWPDALESLVSLPQVSYVAKAQTEELDCAGDVFGATRGTGGDFVR